MSRSRAHEEERRPVLLIAVGRQRVGKTVFLNTTAQFLRAHGANVVLWNADQKNVTHSLSHFHPDVAEPRSSSPEDVKAWLEQRFIELTTRGYNAIVDVGGGDTPLATLVDELPIVETLEEEGVRVVLVHVIGPETADLDYLAQFQLGRRFAPEATLLVLNKGLILTGRSEGVAFAEVKRQPAFLEALGNGAVVATFPRLPCMSEVTDKRLTFTEAMSGVAKDGKPSLSLFDKQRVVRWWTKELPKFFIEEIPEHWLPEMPLARQMAGE